MVYQSEFLLEESAEDFCLADNSDSHFASDVGDLVAPFRRAKEFVLEAKRGESPYVCLSRSFQHEVIAISSGVILRDAKTAKGNWIVVHPSFHRKGLATDLHDFQVAQLRSRGVRVVYNNAVTPAGRGFLMGMGYQNVRGNLFSLRLQS